MDRLRGIAFETYLYTSALVMGLLAAPLLLFGEKSARLVTSNWTRMSLSALRAITGISYRIEGDEHIPQKGALIAANHQSMWETIALYALLPRPVMVFKKELTHLPIYGWFALRAGNIAVDRNGGVKAMRDLQRKAARAVEDGAQVIVFPEGTRMKPGETARFQPGIAGIYTASGAPCVPVAHDSGRFWRHPGPAKRSGEVTLRFLPPIEPALDRKEFLARLQNAINAARPDINDMLATKDADHG